MNILGNISGWSSATINKFNFSATVIIQAFPLEGRIKRTRTVAVKCDFFYIVQNKLFPGSKCPEILMTHSIRPLWSGEWLGIMEISSQILQPHNGILRFFFNIWYLLNLWKNIKKFTCKILGKWWKINYHCKMSVLSLI